MAFRTGTANGYLHLLALLRSYARGWASESARSFTGTGNGTLQRLVFLSDVAQTWTIQLTSATTATVTGSVSGNVGTATVGTLFTAAPLQLLLVAGTTPFAAGATFTVTAVASNVPAADRWADERFVLDYTEAEASEWIARGPGAGADQIYVGVKTAFNVTGQWWNWRLAGFTGYASASSWETQPGSSGENPHPVHLTLQNTDVPFWLMVNARRLLVVAKVNNAFCTAYLGFLKQFATPGQYPYPLVVMGSLSFGAGATPVVTSTQYRFDGGLAANGYLGFNTGVPSGGEGIGRGPLRLRLPNGVWRDHYAILTARNFFNAIPFGATSETTFNQLGTNPTVGGFAGVWPFCAQPTALDPNLDGSYPLFPATLFTGTQTGDGNDVLGELEGISYVPGVGLAAEDTVTIGGTTHLVIPNITNTAAGQLAAIALA